MNRGGRTTSGSRWAAWLGARRRRTAVILYLVLLALSHATQVANPRVWIPPPEESGQKFIDLPEMSRDGPVPGETMHVAYIEWPAQVPRTDPGDPARLPLAGPSERVPVILLHGSPGQGFDFTRLGPELAAAGYRAIAPDLPGFGNSSGLVESYSNRAHARALLAMMDSLGIRRAHVVGWSNGGGVGLNMADLASERIASLTLLAATGIQETEGSGSYWFEHAKYAVAYAGLVVAPEVVPHFGIIGERKLRHAFVRSFLDTDQRPVRAIMERLRVPTMVLHGRDDVLVPFAGAVEHHQLIRTSRLVVMDANHFLPFLQPDETAEHLAAFFARHDVPGVPPASEIVDLTDGPTRVDEMLEKPAVALRKAPWWIEVALIAALSLAHWRIVLACAAVLVATMNLDFGVALVGLLIGRAARARPGRSPRQWLSLVGTLVGGLLAARLISPWVVEPLGNAAGWPGVVGGVGLVTLAVWALPRTLTWRGRASLKAAYARLAHHEYWPAWAFYTPLAPYLLWQGARHGLMSPTCCNPGVGKGGGLIGESKCEILGAMSDPAIMPYALIPAGPAPETRVRVALDALASDGRLGGWPVILKPDAGQRGYAVRLARDPDDVQRYFRDVHAPVVIQRYHPGPHECGILWIRGYTRPDSPPGLTGGIYAVTRKDFATVVGDGRRTLERLILDHPRYRCQAPVFLARFPDARRRRPAEGERVRLGEAGNHCQGTLFRDGSDLITPELEARIDAIAAGFRGTDGHGFDFGRFDVRYESDEALRNGEGFGIVELNGITSEATNLYDPARGPLWAYSILFGQWRELFRIGAERRASGFRPLGVRETITLVRAHFRERSGPSIAD